MTIRLGVGGVCATCAPSMERRTNCDLKKMKKMGFFFFFLGLVSGGDDGGGATEPTGISQADEVKFYLSMERLRANLMRDYSRDVRPTVVNGGALTVYLAMSASNLELVR